MYSLVKFYDGIHYVCKSNTISVSKGIIKATYSNRRRYTANILARNDKESVLKQIVENIIEGKPYIICKRINFENKKVNKFGNDDAQVHLDNNTRIRSIDENIYNNVTASQEKGCESFVNDAEMLDINTKKGSVDKNTCFEETATQRENCESLKNDDAQVLLTDDTRIAFIDENIYNGMTASQEKGCESFVNDAEMLDINTKKDSVDKNTCIKETAAQRENCDSLKNDDAQISLADDTRIAFIDENIYNGMTASQEKGCESFVNDAEMLDINTLINAIDKNENIGEMHIKGCNFLENSGILMTIASPYGKTKRQRWTEKEKETVLQAFSTHMKNLTLPSLREIQETKKKYSCLFNRTSPQIKTWIHNKQKALRQYE
ncbi:uncharacterized protein LOC114939876 isoform X5 [Nylanderia fulva]|uniref:uncharacterized protein LOC114939876 isoform X5 n=1 Tax=Nylanderia fulva TaxID=613905 RepID=UPI0010FB4D65|nr:uncharacterized protein LOC114939876 isoform X5 [Nylanderia fulva]